MRLTEPQADELALKVEHLAGIISQIEADKAEQERQKAKER